VSLTTRIPRTWLLPLLTGLYVVAGKLGLTLALVNPSATPVWAPTGIAVAALLVLGYRAWPAIFVGAFLVNLTTAGSFATSVGIAAGNTLEGVLAAYLVNRFAAGREAFRRPVNIFKFAALAGLLSPAVSATIGVTTLALADFAPWSHYGSIWLTWWLGDCTGAILVAPVLVVWSTATGGEHHWARARTIEAALLAVILVVSGTLVFGDTTHRGYAFMSIPPLVWIAFRLGTRATAIGLVVMAGLALGGTLQGLGPFGSASPNAALLLLQAFLGITSLTALPLAAAVADRAGIEEQLTKREAEHRAIAALTSDFAMLWRRHADGATALDSVTDGFHQVTGYTLAELQQRGGWTALIHPEERAVVEQALGALQAGREVSGDLRIVTKGGDIRWLRVFSRAFAAAGDAGSRFLTAAQDITDHKRGEEELARHQEMIRLLSTPVLRLHDRLLLLPVVGDVDAVRARQMMQQLIEGIRTNRALGVVIDLTGVAAVDAAAADQLVGTVEMARLMGATAILSGVSASLSQRLVAAGVDLERLQTAGDLQAGVEDARRIIESHALDPRRSATVSAKGSSAQPS